jgi:hypothetical protein
MNFSHTTNTLTDLLQEMGAFSSNGVTDQMVLGAREYGVMKAGAREYGVMITGKAA